MFTFFSTSLATNSGLPSGAPSRMMPSSTFTTTPLAVREVGEDTGKPWGHHTVVLGLDGLVMVVESTRPLAGPSSTRMSTTSFSSSSLPTQVPSSKYQACRARPGTLSLMRSMMGRSTKENSRAAMGSPWWKPSWLRMEVSP